MTALQGAVSGKASVNDSAALEADANADIEALWARLALKSNASTVEEVLGAARRLLALGRLAVAAAREVLVL